MGSPQNEIAGVARPLKRFDDFGFCFCIHQVIRAYLCHDGEHVQLSRGDTDRAKNVSQAVVAGRIVWMVGHDMFSKFRART